MPGCHLPLLYIGVEYGLTNNVKLAEKFFTEALGTSINNVPTFLKKIPLPTRPHESILEWI